MERSRLDGVISIEFVMWVDVDWAAGDSRGSEDADAMQAGDWISRVESRAESDVM